MDHRDAMHPERRSRNPRSAGVSAEDQPQRPSILAGTRWNQRRPVGPTCCGWCSAHTAALRGKSSRAVRILPLPWQPADHRRMVTAAWLFVPEGHRRKLAGGKLAPAGAAPGGHVERGHAPAGHRRNFWHRSARSVSATARRLGQAGQFFDAPLGHGATPHGFRGRRPLTRTCPRLISSGVPPGRETGGQPGQPLSRNDAVRATGARPSGRRNARPQLPLPTTRTRTTTHYLVSKKERLEIRSPDTGRTFLRPEGRTPTA